MGGAWAEGSGGNFAEGVQQARVKQKSWDYTTHILHIDRSISSIPFLKIFVQDAFQETRIISAMHLYWFRETHAEVEF